MIDVNRHKFLMVQILRDIFGDVELANALGFKGGTALMFFYGLDRFSVDLDFNLLDEAKAVAVFEKVERIVLRYGIIKDKAMKHFGMVLVISYENGQRNLKVEISQRKFDDAYEIKDFLGIPVRVMQVQDMFAHKLCALLDRSMLTGRDVYDCWFFMQKRTPINKAIVETRMKEPLASYFDRCIAAVEKMRPATILHGIGELVDPEQKTFVRNKLKDETLGLLKTYQRFPLP